MIHIVLQATAFALQLQVLRSVSTQVDARGGLVRREDRNTLERGDISVTAEREALADVSNQPNQTTNLSAAGTEELADGEIIHEDPNEGSGQPGSTTPVPTVGCNDDYVLGVENTNFCSNRTHHRLIFDEGTCLKAAELAGANTEHGLFHIDHIYEDLHPQGCFAYHCGHTAKNTSIDNQTEICYYYNNNGEEPENPHGFPVCYRADFLNGTVNTNGGCDKHYENVMDEKTCSDAAECLGFSKEPEFRIGEYDWSKHHEYPKGCFIRTDTGGFQYNDISSMNGTEPARPHVGGGIPVCNVSSTVHWPSEGGTTNPIATTASTAINISNFPR